MKNKILLFLLLFTSISFAQINMDGLKKLAKDKAKQKAHDAAVAAKAKVNDAVDKKLEKERAEFDASNFNYAISFTDNSGLFETEEKGSKVSNTLIRSKDFLKGKEHNDYQRAYGYNRKGEILFAGNKFGSAFYKNYAASGNKQEAFLAAQKQIKIKYKEPFYWGAFVLIGN
jgi:hypothetical protein